MANSPKIVELRKLLAGRFPEACQEPRSSTSPLLPPVPDLDKLELPRGAISELVVSKPHSGGATLLLHLMHHAWKAGQFCAIIDAKDSFDPTPLPTSLQRKLLWVRTHHAVDAMKATDLLLRDGNIPFIFLDLGLNPLQEIRRLSSSEWYRFQTLVHHTNTVFLALTPHPIVSSARLRIQLNSQLSLADLDQSTESLQSGLKIQITRQRLVSSWQEEGDFNQEEATG